ncbi:MAG: ubiquinol oxidase subunit II [Pseudomonadota bacterium]
MTRFLDSRQHERQHRSVKIGLRLLCLLACTGLSGCNYLLFDPKGPIAQQQMEIIIFSVVVMLIVVIPVMIMGVWFPIQYRADNDKSDYRPNWEHSNKIEAVVWAIPVAIIVTLGWITFVSSHDLDPREPIDADQPTMVVQVVALDWKWLFIYPEYQIATVNEFAMPVGTPVEFLITSATVMNSFFIPNLGTQIYAMSGMENRLHLMASQRGTYPGFSANYSGFGFSGMKFNALATDQPGFDEWVAKVKASDQTLDDTRFEQLKQKSRDVAPMYFASVNPLLFSDIIQSYTGGFNGGS